METAPLKSFATWARTSLIREVSARIAVVLAPGSSERVEQPEGVEDLEKAVASSGGGDKGKDAVADKVAYTWFNRIIALRFMDANGYTGIGVVSPQSGVEVGQPEILAEAKRDNIDATVVGGKTRDAITALLNGTRRSDDAQGEAYALLLADYCRHWNRAMPFMFEREGDYTELLIPANLLADDSVPSRAVRVLTKDVCQDVEVIGWLYQFYISDRKDEVFAGFKKGKKAGADEIPAATQLFTPHWIVRYLVENSLGRLWMFNRPTSRLIEQMQYFITPADRGTEFRKIDSPEELKLVDPACGSGHILTYAFDLLYAIYEEEGYAAADIPTLILTKNLRGVEIDARAGALAAFALTMKARAKQRNFFRRAAEPNICVLGSISLTPDQLRLLTPTGAGFERVEELLDQSASKTVAAIHAFWRAFEHADTLGSLIQPDARLIEPLRAHLETLHRDSDDRLFDFGDGTLPGTAQGELTAPDTVSPWILAEVLVAADTVIAQAEYLSQNYHLAVTNPPYMGAGNMNATLSGFVRAEFPNAKQDLYGCFVQRATRLVSTTGIVAMILGDTWMSIKGFEEFRRQLLNRHAFASFVHLRDVSNHPDIFGANGAFALDMAGRSDAPVPYFRLTALDEEEKRRRLVAAIKDSDSPDQYLCTTDDLARVPGMPIAYWISNAMRAAFTMGKPLSELFAPRNGLSTSDNEQFLRFWWEVARSRTYYDCPSLAAASESPARWFPLNKGGEYRRWYGNQSHTVNWESDGRAVKTFIVDRYPYLNGNPGIKVRSTDCYFLPQVSWSSISSGTPSFREYPSGLIFDGAAKSLFPSSDEARHELLAILNSSVITEMLSAIAPTLNFEAGQIGQLPILAGLRPSAKENVRQLVAASKLDWDYYETSWNFAASPLLGETPASLENIVDVNSAEALTISMGQRAREAENNRIVAEAFGLEDEVSIEVPLHRVSLTRNVHYRYGPGRASVEYAAREREDIARDFVSYAVGCMFGRYSLDEPGLILADQGSKLEDYLVKVPNPTFAPDKDNVIPIVDGDWFEDDIVARFRTFLRIALGDKFFEDNVRFVADSLGVKDVREYFIKAGNKAASSKFYDDHVQRYRKRPIYWLFSSPKGSFNALIYVHRYTPSTVSTVLNEYLREYRAKLAASLQQQELAAAGGGNLRQQAIAQKEADRLRKVLVELDEYEHDVLYPLASRQLTIDLDDGVKANYPKFGEALKRIPGLEASDD